METSWTPPAVPCSVAALGTLARAGRVHRAVSTLNPTAAALGAGVAGPHLDPQLDEHRPRRRSCSPPARVADDFGRRRTFVGGVAGARGRRPWSAAVAHDVRGVRARAGRAGRRGAAVIAASLGMLGRDVPDPGPGRGASGIWGASLGAGIAVGPLLSSGLTLLGSWRDVYVVVVAAGVVVAAPGARVRASPAPRTGRGSTCRA